MVEGLCGGEKNETRGRVNRVHAYCVFTGET